MRNIALIASLIAGLAGCSRPSSGLSDSQTTSALRVATQKSSYTRSEITTEGQGIRGTITNPSDRTVYARLGDAFNSAVEQDPVWIANGSDGALERYDGTAWMAVLGATLVEGVREIELRPNRSYAFIAHGPNGATPGTYRVSVTFRVTSGASQGGGRASSETFEIR